MAFYENDFISVVWDEEIQIVSFTWKKFAPSKIYRQGLEKIMELTSLKRAKGLLGDTRNFKAVSIEDQEWSVKEWTPKMFELGMRRSAVVVPASVLGQISISSMMGKTDLPDASKTKYFSDLTEARQWLKAELAKI